ncbi:MAG: hypothetical protein MUC90_06825 [Thermoplasmata archaeon]|nr:hypothetical protein [Thermoplasmata archaeon]
MVEIFYDELAMNHTVPYKGRLEMDSPTTPAGELMLQKLQVVKINEKDIKDLIVLIRAHDKSIVTQRVDTMLALIESKPKSFKWRMRAKVGTKTMWYNPVDDW